MVGAVRGGSTYRGVSLGDRHVVLQEVFDMTEINVHL